jgi:hypothetical protein
MVRECRPPAREPARSWLGRRSTMATSTPANANSPANISPVGPPPAITTAWFIIASLQSFPQPRSTRPRATGTSTTIRSFRGSVGSGFGRRFYGMTLVLKQAAWAPHIKVAGLVSRISKDGCESKAFPPHTPACRRRARSTRTAARDHEYAGNTRHSPRNGFDDFLRALVSVKFARMCKREVLTNRRRWI